MIAGRQNELKGVRRFGSAPGSRDPAPKSLRGIGTRGATFGLRLWETRANRGPASLGGPSITFFSFLSQNFSPAPHCGAGPDLWKARPLVPSQSTLQPPPTALEPGRARKSRPRTPISLFIGGGRRLRRAQRGGAAFEVAAAAAFILSFFPLRPLCVTKFGKNMDPSQSFHVCSQLPALSAMGLISLVVPIQFSPPCCHFFLSVTFKMALSTTSLYYSIPVNKWPCDISLSSTEVLIYPIRLPESCQ